MVSCWKPIAEAGSGEAIGTSGEIVFRDGFRSSATRWAAYRLTVTTTSPEESLTAQLRDGYLVTMTVPCGVAHFSRQVMCWIGGWCRKSLGRDRASPREARRHLARPVLLIHAIGQATVPKTERHCSAPSISLDRLIPSRPSSWASGIFFPNAQTGCQIRWNDGLPRTGK